SVLHLLYRHLAEIGLEVGVARVGRPSTGRRCLAGARKSVTVRLESPAGDGVSVVDHRFSVTEHRKSAIDLRKSVADFRFPLIDHRSRINRDRIPVIDDRIPVIDLCRRQIRD
ncbi:MAG TPA: hypothetical protein VGF69_16600, partial [Thermoanaerobaculia bacterium]